MKKEFKKVVVLDGEDIKNALALAKDLVKLLNNDELALGEANEQLIHDTISYLEEIESEYND